MKHLSRAILAIAITLATISAAHAFWGGGTTDLAPENGFLRIPLSEISDGKAHFFRTKADDGTAVTFFTLKSGDGVIRAAIDACDVCYRSGKGYRQEGDFMVCENCGMKFRSDRINEVSGGCNPAPLKRIIEGGHLVIDMKDINDMSWYCRYK
jgi:uncharacterized membrane protein